MSTTSLQRIDKQLENLDPESLRAHVLISLRCFRSSWVELGRLLTEVAYGGDYKDWGYDDFEIYCARELGLKKPTVKKLMVSYNYMKSYEPERLEQKSEEVGYDVPDYQTVDLLHKMRGREDLPDEDKSRIHEMAFEGNGDETDLRRELRDRMHGRDDGEGVADANRARRRELDDILRTARQLRKKVAQARSVPDGLKDRIESALLELEALD